jgi:hypothetical protein
MMTITREDIKTCEEAIALAFREAKVEDMKAEVADLFGMMVDGIPQQQVTKVVGTAVKAQYGKDVEWEIDNWWQVPVPLPRYEASSLPSLVVETIVHLVASVEITSGWSGRSWHIALIEPLGKSQKTVLPLCFVEALLDGDEGRYRIVGKEGGWTLREIGGLKDPLRLHDSFVAQLREVFKARPVADWLDDFGARGHALAPLVVGSLLGLMCQGNSALVPPEEQACDHETLIQIATSLGYGVATAKKALQWAEPELKAAMNLEEKIRILLKYISEEA